MKSYQSKAISLMAVLLVSLCGLSLSAQTQLVGGVALKQVATPAPGSAAPSPAVPVPSSPSPAPSSPAPVPSSPAPAPSSPALSPTMPLQLAPLPAIELFQHFEFPGLFPTVSNEPKWQLFSRGVINTIAEKHFLLIDKATREAFLAKWLAKVPAVKDFDAADELNRECLRSLNQRFDYYYDTEQAAQIAKVVDPTIVGIGSGVQLKNVDEIIDALPADTTQEALEKLMVVSKEHPLVLSPFKDSPGFKAGLRESDEVWQVDGKELTGKSLEEIVKQIKGKEGTKVELTVARADKDGVVAVLPKPIVVTRAAFAAPAVHTRLLPDGVTYIKLDNFMANGADAQMLAALQDAAKVKDGKIIFDLRGNGGGRLDYAINIVSYMLPEGTIVTLREREGDRLIKIHYTATLDAVLTTRPVDYREDVISYSAAPRKLAVPKDMPIVILINGNSASASELTAGSLQFHGRAKLVGENSRGKGVGQEVFMPEKREIHVTKFFFDPADRETDFEGLHADKECKLGDYGKKIKELRGKLVAALAELEKVKADPDSAGKAESDIAAIRANLAGAHAALKADPQLQAAQEVAKAEFNRIQGELAEQKAKRDATVKIKTDEWQAELKAREQEESEARDKQAKH